MTTIRWSAWVLGVVAMAVSWTGSVLAATPAQVCEAKKLQAAGTKANCLLRAYANQVQGKAANFDACTEKFTTAFEKAEKPGECPTVGDTAAIEAQVDAAAANLAAALSGAFGQAVVVFDNTSSGIFGTTFCAVGCELGNQITLAGPERIVTEFLFGYRGFFAVPGSELAQTARVRFYANDGVITGGSPSPGTLLFDSQPFPIASGPGFQEITLTGLLVPVPETFTWAVEFSGDPPNAILQIAGLLAVLDPATIGAVDLQWVRSANPEPGCFAGCWAPRRADSPPTSPGSPFKARVTAIVEPADRGNRGD